MNEEIEALTKRVDELQARDTATLAFLRSAFWTLDTPYLRGALVTFEKLAEELAVKLLYSETTSDAATAAFESRKRLLVQDLQAEIAARERAGRAG